MTVSWFLRSGNQTLMLCVILAMLLGDRQGVAQEALTLGDEPRVERGELTDNDPVFEGVGATGEVHDAYELEVPEERRRLTIAVSSNDFDTVLILQGLDESGEPDFRREWQNDDIEEGPTVIAGIFPVGGGGDSRLELQVPDAGRYRVIVKAYEAGERGPYTLSLAAGETLAELDPVQLRLEMGALTDDDEIWEEGGQFSDSFEVEVEAGRRLVVDLWAEDFDPFLAIYRVEENGELNGPWRNDDYGGNQRHSRLEIDESSGARYRILVTAYEFGVTGTYELRAVTTGIPAGQPAMSPAPTGEFPANANERLEVGNLSPFDRESAEGHYYDRYVIPVVAGERLKIRLVSLEFDSLLKVSALDENDNADPAREWINDDADAGASEVDFVAPTSGDYRILVTTFEPRMQGRYDLTIARMNAAEAGGARSLEVGENDRLEVGNLNRFDEQTEDGSYQDALSFEAKAGQRVVVELYSTEFDPYLVVRSDAAEGFEQVNDDDEGSRERAKVEFDAPADGEYQVKVSSYEVGATGLYQVVIRVTDPDPAAAPLGPPEADAPQQREVQGELGAGDEQLGGGEWYERHVVQGRPGQRIRLDLTSDAFDTYLLFRSPSGTLLEADDFQGSESRTVLETVMVDAGDHEVLVTSYEAGESGAYRLTIETDSLGGIDQQGLLVSPSRFPVDLTAQSQVVEGDRFGDVYPFETTAGTRIRARMSSEAFDPVFLLRRPDGSVETYDDQEAGSSDAVIDLETTQDGRHELVATSFDSGETGRYQLSFGLGDAAALNKGPRIRGVFVGVADYPDGVGDLERCDVDAQRLHSLLIERYGMLADDSALLVNREATVEGVRAALARVGGASGPDDLLIFFFSGHGDQIAGEPDAADPDGKHEALSLVDGELDDDALAALINASGAGTAMVVIDACYSGGFAKDVVSAPGRMGIFASEEDVLAQVAESFEAGGYLSRFLIDALFQRRDEADLDRDQALSAFELCHHLGERYRDEVRSGRPEKEQAESDKAAKIRTGEPKEKSPKLLALLRSQDDIDPAEDLSYQRLVVDRGGVEAGRILFGW